MSCPNDTTTSPAKAEEHSELLLPLAGVASKSPIPLGESKLNRRRSSGVLNRIKLKKKIKMPNDELHNNNRRKSTTALDIRKNIPFLPFSRKRRETISVPTSAQECGDNRKDMNIFQTQKEESKSSKPLFSFNFDSDKSNCNEPLSPTHFSPCPSNIKNVTIDENDIPMTPHNTNQENEINIIQTPPSYARMDDIVSMKLLGDDVRSKSKNRRKSVKNELRQLAKDSSTNVPIFNISNEEIQHGKENLEPLLPAIMFPDDDSNYNKLNINYDSLSDDDDLMQSGRLPKLSEEEERSFYWDLCYKDKNVEISSSQLGCWSANRVAPAKSWYVHFLCEILLTIF